MDKFNFLTILFKITQKLHTLYLFEKYLYFSRNMLIFNKHIGD
jgi:hypothetical protein